MQSESIARRATVEELVRTYAEAERAILAGCAAVSGAVDQLNERLGALNIWSGARFGNTGHSRFDFADPSDQIVDLRRQIWRALVERLEVRRMMSVARAKKLDEWLAKVDEEITVDNVMGLFEVTARDLPDMLTEAVEEVYNWLRPWNSRHETNTQYEVGERVVLTGALDTWWISLKGAPHVSSYRIDYVRALENVFSALDGKGQISKTYYGELGDAIAAATSGKGQTTYFEFKWFKNGNLHLKMRRMDLVDKFNKIAGGQRLKHDNTARKQPKAGEAA